MVIALRNRKRNNGRLIPQMGFRLEFVNSAADELVSVRFRRTDLADVPELSAKMPLKDRILAELRQGPVATGALAAALDKPVEVVSARLGDLRLAKKVVKTADGLYALMARGEVSA